MYTPSSHASSRASTLLSHASTPLSHASTPLIKNEGRLFSCSASFSPNPFRDCIGCHRDENRICICHPRDNDWFSDHEGRMACEEGECLGCVGGFCICTEIWDITFYLCMISMLSNSTVKIMCDMSWLETGFRSDADTPVLRLSLYAGNMHRLFMTRVLGCAI